MDAKNWSGSVSMRDGVLRQNGYRRDRQVDAVRQASRDVAAQLQLPWALHLIPVICHAGSRASRVHRLHDVTVVGHDELVAWATTLPARLTPGDVLGIAAHLRSALPPAAAPAPRRRHAASRQLVPGAVPRSNSAARGTRGGRRAASRTALGKPLVVAVFVMALPSLLAGWPRYGPDVMRPLIPLPSASSTPATGATGAAAVTPFPSCRALRAKYPGGVAQPAAVSTGHAIPRGVVLDEAAYRSNAALDVDGDGIACEARRR